MSIYTIPLYDTLGMPLPLHALVYLLCTPPEVRTQVHGGQIHTQYILNVRMTSDYQARFPSKHEFGR